MKAIKKLYNFKEQTVHNPFVSNNQENRMSQMNSSIKNGSDESPNSIKITEVRRTRKFNDMCCDSPISNKPNTLESDEEEKHNVSMQSSQSQHSNLHNEEVVCAEFSKHLLDELKVAPSEDAAELTIRKYLLEYKKHPFQSFNVNPGQKKKRIYSEKDMKAVSGAIKNLSKDNVMLKNSVRKLVERDEQNKCKINQFDNLVQQYSTIRVENEKLKNCVDFLKFAAIDKCNDGTFSDYGSNNHGGPGVF